MAAAHELVVVGVSHHTAPLAVRERIAVNDEQVPHELRAIMTDGAAAEGMLISTCNRVELYGTATDTDQLVNRARSYLRSRAAPEAIDGFLYERRGPDAAGHAFRVVSSLDSMVVGEPQILGQMKRAFAVAEAAGAVGTVLGHCFRRAFAVAKRVRTETLVGAGAVSVSSIAVSLAQQIFGDLIGRRVLLVGAGKMGEAAVKSLAKQNARLVVLNRSPERAEELARNWSGEARPLEHLAQELVRADVVIASTMSDRFIITDEMMRSVVKARRRRPLFLIDISVPRNIDPRVEELDNTFLYDLDDLQKIAGDNLAARKREVAAAEAIVAKEAASFARWHRSLAVTPTIVALRERVRETVLAELQKTLPRMSSLSEDDRKVLEAMCEGIVNKLVHRPLTELKKGASEPEGPVIIDIARRLYGIDLSTPSIAPAQPPEDPKKEPGP